MILKSRQIKIPFMLCIIRLEKLQSLFDEMGAETCEDLMDVYTDSNAVKRAEKLLRPVEFSRFKRAAKETQFLKGNIAFDSVFPSAPSRAVLHQEVRICTVSLNGILHVIIPL